MRIYKCLLQKSIKHSSSVATRPAYDPYNALTQVFLDNPADNTGSLRYAVKDNICTTRGATTCSSRILGAATSEGYRSPFNATCIELLDAAKCTIAAKTNMDEFGMGSFTTNSPYGPTLNPHALERTAGGSSGGSAAALFMSDAAFPPLDFALGTDTGGSVRIPASYCGLFGFKPSYGRLSRWGVVPYANSLDTVGIMNSKSQGLDMLRKVFDLLNKSDEKDPTSLTDSTRSRIAARQSTREGKIRIGVPSEYHVEEIATSVLITWRKALDQLANQDCEIVPVPLPLTRAALAAYYVLAPSEASSNLQKYSGVFYGARQEPDRLDGRLYAATRDLFGDEVKRRILMGCFSLSASSFDNYYLQAQRIRRSIVEDFNFVFRQVHPLLPSAQMAEGVDYLLCPVAPTVAPLLSEISGMTSAEAHARDVFTVPASMAGVPALSIPFGEDEQGLPIGVQLIGQYGDDQGVLQVASRFC